MGLNDDVGEGLPSEDYVPEFAKTPDYNSKQVAAPEVVLITGMTTPVPTEPITAARLFGNELVPNELPNLDAEFVIVDNEASDVFSLAETKERLEEAGSIAQEDARQIHAKHIPNFLNDKNPLVYYSRIPSKSRLSFSLESLGDTLEVKYGQLVASTVEMIKSIDTNTLVYLRSLDEKVIDSATKVNAAITEQLSLCGPEGLDDLDYTLPDGKAASDLFFSRTRDFFAPVTKRYLDEDSYESVDKVYCCVPEIDSELKRMRQAITDSEVKDLFEYYCHDKTIMNVVTLSERQYLFDEKVSDEFMKDSSVVSYIPETYRSITYELVLRNFGGQRGKEVIDNLKAALGILLGRNQEALGKIEAFAKEKADLPFSDKFAFITKEAEYIKLSYSLMARIVKMISLVLLSVSVATNILTIVNGLKAKKDTLITNSDMPTGVATNA